MSTPEASTVPKPSGDLATGDTGEFFAQRPAPRLSHGAVSHPGKVRSNNEDRFLIAKLAKSMQICQTNVPHVAATRFSDEDGYLFVMADGMGGARAGERASTIAVETVEQFTLNTLKWFFHLGGAGENVLMGELRQLLESADRSVCDEGEADASLAGMGTTLTMGYCVGSDLYIVHAGDSRAYHFHADGQLDQVTNDHTLVQLLVNNGMLTPEAARTHNRRNVVTNVIGGPRPGVQAEIQKIRLQPGDQVLFCTDGLTEVVADEAIAETLGRKADPQSAAQRLVDLALARGGPDNVSVIVVRYQGEPEPADASKSKSC